MNVQDFPASVIHVHILANGQPAPGNGALWKWTSQERLPAAGKLMTSAEVHDLVDFAAGRPAATRIPPLTPARLGSFPFLPIPASATGGGRDYSWRKASSG
jgi:hypothetical protein